MTLPFFIIIWQKSATDKEKEPLVTKGDIYNAYYKTSRYPIAQKFVYAKSYTEILSEK